MPGPQEPSSQAARAPGARRGGWAAALALGLTPPIAVGGGLAMAPLAAAAGLAGAPYRSAARLLRAGGLPLLLLGLFVLWAMASAFWSAAPTRWEAAAKLAGGVATGLGLLGGVLLAGRDGRSLVRAAAAAGALMLGALLTIEALFAMPFNRLAQPDPVDWVVAINPGHGGSILAVLVWPAILSVHGRLRLPVALAALALAAFACTRFENHTNIVAFLAGGAAALLAARWPRATLTALGAFFAALVLLAPLWASLLPHADALPLPYSWLERIEMWRSSAARTAQAPLFGHGLDAVRLMKAAQDIGGVEYHFISLHPHNAGLHIWLELGAVGAALAAAALFFGGRGIARALSGDAATAAAAGACAFAAHAFLSLGVWQEWWIATAFVLAASVAALKETQET
ncbi:MAG: hypothetical protein JNJ73_15215 [Hyphomonadaceae bacterium]|nr:hypothetical protein [Hyphomonadaceae bacterium]